MAKEPAEIARGFLNAAQERLDMVDLVRCGPDSVALFWALSDAYHAIEQVLQIVEEQR